MSPISVGLGLLGIVSSSADLLASLQVTAVFSDEICRTSGDVLDIAEPNERIHNFNNKNVHHCNKGCEGLKAVKVFLNC